MASSRTTHTRAGALCSTGLVQCHFVYLVMLLFTASFAGHVAASEVRDYHRAVTAVKQIYDQCKDQLNRGDGPSARESCNKAAGKLKTAQAAFEKISGPDRKKAPVPALYSASSSYGQLIINALESLKGPQADAQIASLAGARSGRVAATQATTFRPAVALFNPDQFDGDSLEYQIRDVLDWPGIRRLQVDAFAAGNVSPHLAQQYSAICAQWVEWYLRNKGRNPLEIVSNGWGHLDDRALEFPRYFDSDKGPTRGLPPHCVAGLDIAHWDEAQLGFAITVMTPDSDWPASEIDWFITRMEDTDLLQVELMGHAEGPGSPDEITQYGLDCAEAVMQAMIAGGVEPTRLSTQTYGNSLIDYGTASSDQKPWSCGVSIRAVLTLD